MQCLQCASVFTISRQRLDKLLCFSFQCIRSFLALLSQFRGCHCWPTLTHKLRRADLEVFGPPWSGRHWNLLASEESIDGGALPYVGIAYLCVCVYVSEKMCVSVCTKESVYECMCVCVLGQKLKSKLTNDMLI